MESIRPAINKFATTLIFITMFQIHHRCHAQQAYLNNKQLNCYVNYTNTNGFLCNGASTACSSYLTFRAIEPYNRVTEIAYFLNADVASIVQLNNVNDVHKFATNELVVVPINCSCTSDKKYYQHNATYTLKSPLETYLLVANDTYQGLTTCQTLIEQNPYDSRNLSVGEKLIIPIMCACPTVNQTKVGVRSLVNYVATENDDPSKIADMFGVDLQSILDANKLNDQSVIYPFNPILVPITTSKPQIRLPSPPPPMAEGPSTNGTGGSGSGAESSKTWVYAVVGVAAGALVISLVSCFICFYRRRRMSTSEKYSPSSKGKGDKLGDVESSEHVTIDTITTTNGGNSSTTNSWPISSEGVKYAIGSLSFYKFDEIKKATASFSESSRIKGSVYKGTFKGDAAAVKILKGDVAREINILKQINHLNIIRLSGYCVHDGNTYIVYEFAEKGSLRDWLEMSRENEKDQQCSVGGVLDWKTRVQIAFGVADALNYLHNYARPPYIHKNLTSSNVLLDTDFRAKVSNFGLARSAENEDEGGLHLTNYVVGTQGYLSPEYIENGVVTPKLDLFAFGMVILELLSGKIAGTGSSSDGKNFSREEILTAASVREVFEGGNVREKLERFMDSALQEYPVESAYSMLQLANSCVAHDMNSRPSVSEVLMIISKIHSSSLDWNPSDELDRTSSISH